MTGDLDVERVLWARQDGCVSDNTWFLQGDQNEKPNDQIYKEETQSSWPQRLLLSMLCMFSLFALAAATLSQSITTSPAHDDGHPEIPSETTPSRKVIQIHEDIPSTAQLRNLEEYTLSPSWDLDAHATTREYFWTVTSASLNPDGIYRPMILINNQFPGPLVECNEGDTVVVHIMNQSPNATAIHFHGMFQNGTNNMDGTVGITQCPIAPNTNFTYKFDVKGQHGTYWYHAHHSAQAADGLLGPMVVHSKQERKLQRLDYATDRVVMVQDHYHNLTSELLMEYLAPDQENDEPVPDNILINGRGVRDCSDFPGWPCDTTNVSTLKIDLEAGKRHRLRIINVGAFAEFQIQFDEHAFYITEVDGTFVHPEPFHRLNVLPAQRYSVVLETNVNSSSAAFWMRSRMVTHCFKRDNERLQPELRAIIRYTSSGWEPPVAQPTSKEWSEAIEVICRDLNTTALRPVETVSPPLADDVVVLRANFEIGDWRLARGFFNDSTWHGNATHPSLHQYLDASINDTAKEKPISVNEQAFDRKKELVLETTGIRTIDISINNFDDGAHPFHLHGHKFFVLLQGNSGYPPNSTELPRYLEEHKLLDNPLRRDTITVEGYAWAIIRVVLDNPGMWAFHCHNMWHAESGMVMQLLVRSDVVREWEVDPDHREMCGREGVTTGMRPEDSIWFGQFRE
ncbi:hypothetical protein N0V84_005363 [Fusarium piperis]|uniref:Multicopper oxidase n=1 Tax=Fusarium piperis TaxID=1435070 RepID=A0A9W8WE38_9HYPO|nr:hypothetical protein N0V84_005363 [Fusarium piperis]